MRMASISILSLRGWDRDRGSRSLKETCERYYTNARGPENLYLKLGDVRQHGYMCKGGTHPGKHEERIPIFDAGKESKQRRVGGSGFAKSSRQDLEGPLPRKARMDPRDLDDLITGPVTNLDRPVMPRTLYVRRYIKNLREVHHDPSIPPR